MKLVIRRKGREYDRRSYWDSRLSGFLSAHFRKAYMLAVESRNRGGDRRVLAAVRNARELRASMGDIVWSVDPELELVLTTGERLRIGTQVDAASLVRFEQRSSCNNGHGIGCWPRVSKSESWVSRCTSRTLPIAALPLKLMILKMKRTSGADTLTQRVAAVRAALFAGDANVRQTENGSIDC
jgi:hypothetical protein